MARFPVASEDAWETGTPMRRIESVEARASGTVKITVGGSSFLARSAFLSECGLEPCNLTPGTGLDEEGMASLTLAADATGAERQAASLIARAEQTKYLLGAKLEKKGLSPRAVRLALDHLEADGLLSDRRYAEAWLRSRLGQGGGGQSPLKLLSGLRSRGIAEDIARKAIKDIFGPEERRAALAKAIAREKRKAEPDRAELRRRLRRLGFGAEEIRVYFEETAGPD